MFPVFYAGHHKDIQNQTQSSQAFPSLGYILFCSLIALCATWQPKTDLFSYWPQFATTITAAGRILGSEGLRWGEEPAHLAVAQACCPWDRIGTCLVGVSAGIVHNWLGGFDLGVRRRGRKGTKISFQPFWLIADPSQRRGDNGFSVHFVCLWS